MIWFCIEARVLRFILLLLTSRLFQNYTHTIKYFLFQAITSILLLLRLVIFLQQQDVLALIIIIKLGIAPFHLWFMTIMSNISLLNLIWVSVVQKVIPLRFMLTVKYREKVLSILVFSFMLGAFHILFQTKLIKIVAASSVYTTAWIFIRFSFSEALGWVFFIFYRIIQISFLVSSWKTQILPFKPRYRSRILYNGFRLVLILSLGGFPPRPLFFMKIRVLRIISMNFSPLLTLFILLLARIVIYNYLNLVRSLYTLSTRKRF